MLKKYDFFHKFMNKKGKGFDNQFEVRTIRKWTIKDYRDKVVIDRTSNLMWQQGGSSEKMKFEKACQWVKELRHGNYKDWRLPTLEEAMSLVEPEKKHGDLYIDPVFDVKQRWI